MTWLHDAIEGWRSGTRRSQLVALTALLVGVAISMVVSITHYAWFPLTGFFLWLLLGMLLLRFVPLVVLTVMVVGAAVLTRSSAQEMAGGRMASFVLLVVCAAVVLYAASRQRSGLPTPLSEALLADLRDRLDAQGRVPVLPSGWHAQSAMIAAHGVGYAGDFLVADLDREAERLDLVLVDVVGKGMAAAPSSLLLAGALGGMVGTLPGRELFGAANDFMLRQEADETFATAVHFSVHLGTGRYTILSAGHPPALRWNDVEQRWMLDPSRGLALGIAPHPELHASHGELGPGDALMFYTDGVVESRDADLDVGIAWLQETARVALSAGVDGAADRVIRQVPRGDDDRALLVISRDPGERGTGPTPR